MIGGGRYCRASFKLNGEAGSNEWSESCELDADKMNNRVYG